MLKTIHLLIRLTVILALTGSASVNANNTIVTMDTSLGNFSIELYDTSAPITVSNFLSYVNSGAYNDSFIHRSIPGFVIQGGGYTWDTVGNSGYYTIPTNAPIVNEFGASNTIGTIAMAKLGGNPNSATDQWFINLANNGGAPNNLDTANGGYTVFGQVFGNGMQVVNAIASLPTVNAGGAFTNLPLAEPLPSNGAFSTQNLVMIYTVATTAIVAPLPGTFYLFGTALLAMLTLGKRLKNC